MIIISHRGNINGPVPEKENRPSYIDCALQLGYDVEVDIRFINGTFWLGHDTPDYEVSNTWILKRKNNIWFHCKDLDSASMLNELDDTINKFCHTSDSFVLVSNGTVWVHDLTLNLDEKCIIPLINKQNIIDYNGPEVCGICTDFTVLLKNKIK